MRKNRISITGLSLSYNHNQPGIFNQSVLISPGSIQMNIIQDDENNISKWKDEFTYINKENVNLNFSDNNNDFDVINVIYCKPNYIDGKNKVIPINFYCEVKKLDDEIQNDDIFIGLIYTPSHFPQKNIEFSIRSFNESERQTNYNRIFSEWKTELIEKNIELWVQNKLYFKNQIIIFDNKLYKCIISHNSNIFLDEYQKLKFWICLSGDLSDIDFNIFEYGLETVYNKDYLCTYLKILNDDKTYQTRKIVTTEKIQNFRSLR